MREKRFAAICLLAYVLALLLGNVAYARSTGDTTQFAVARFLLTAIVAGGLWLGYAVARWVGLLYSGYLAVGGWIALALGTSTHLYDHQPYPAWIAVSTVLLANIAVSIAFVTLIRPTR
jgi:hypothetical protein